MTPLTHVQPLGSHLRMYLWWSFMYLVFTRMPGESEAVPLVEFYVPCIYSHARWEWHHSEWMSESVDRVKDGETDHILRSDNSAGEWVSEWKMERLTTGWDLASFRSLDDLPRACRGQCGSAASESCCKSDLKRETQRSRFHTHTHNWSHFGKIQVRVFRARDVPYTTCPHS